MPSLPGDLDRLMICAWRNDEAPVVLEIQSENSKATSDSELCTMRELLDELSETVSEFTINCHDLKKPKVGDSEGHGLRASGSPEVFILVSPSLAKYSMIGAKWCTSAAGFSGDSAYTITPKPQQIFFAWNLPTNLAALKHASVASAFNGDVSQLEEMKGMTLRHMALDQSLPNPGSSCFTPAFHGPRVFQSLDHSLAGMLCKGEQGTFDCCMRDLT